jgi:hypothetical protein
MENGPHPKRCEVTIKPGESLRAAVAQADRGTEVCLAKGVWREHLKIDKAGKLRGAGPGETTIRGVEESHPVVWIGGEGDERGPVTVKLEAVTISNAHGRCADWRTGICASDCEWDRVLHSNMRLTEASPTQLEVRSSPL